jgi:hypothetical protein
MKRKIVAALLGIAASVSLVSSAHAQGRVFFNNYGGSGPNATFAPVNYGNGAGGTVGAGVNNTFTAGLWYFLGTATLAAGNGALPVGWEVASITQQINAGATAGAGGEGLFVGPIASISDYVSGPITFSVVAFNGASYANATVRGNSTGFAGSPATGQAATQNFGPGLTSFNVLPTVPEPSIFALSGLGAAALMLIRRKK